MKRIDRYLTHFLRNRQTTAEDSFARVQENREPYINAMTRALVESYFGVYFGEGFLAVEGKS